MFYFIPSWYDKERLWHQMPALWFRVFDGLSFDDSINQLRMFQIAKEPVALIQISYNPHFRYFLHKNDLQTVSYWSFFDDIQNCERQSTEQINFKHLNWPKGIQFIYTPFKVLAKLNNQIFAEINFGENGNLFYIETYLNNKGDKRYIFDDRGFLSSLIVYKKGKLLYQDYLNPKGIWQVREWFDREINKIEINPVSDKEFRHQYYDDWQELINERMKLFAATFLTPEDAVVIAADKRHNKLLLSVMEQQQKIISYSSYRHQVKDEELLTSLSQADILVADSKEIQAELQKELQNLERLNLDVTQITPFDTRLRLGQSQTLKEQTIYFLIDGLSDIEYQSYLSIILDKMVADQNLRLAVVTYDNQRNFEQLEKRLLTDLEVEHRLEKFISKDSFLGENQLDEEAELKLKNISFNIYTNEHQIINSLDTARVVIDLSQKPDTYTQIASISAGLPQINRIESEYVLHRENGWIVNQPDQLKLALDYYLDNLSNWNRSLVYAVQRMTDFTSGRLSEQWKELLKKKEE